MRAAPDSAALVRDRVSGLGADRAEFVAACIIASVHGIVWLVRQRNAIAIGDRLTSQIFTRADSVVQPNLNKTP